MAKRRTIVWWSSGAASAVAARLALRDAPEAMIVRCETNNEDADNYRFEEDVMKWLGKNVTVLRSDEYDSVPDVWDRRAFMSGPKGAPCTLEMKIKPRLSFQRPNDVHVFGYTADPADVTRYKRLCETYFELTTRAPLIDAGITKAATLHLIQSAGIALPRTYGMGFPNANCLKSGCVKATSPNYWALYRKHFPQNFAQTAATARRLGVRLTRIDGERIFIDDIPENWPTTDPIVPACDFLCHLVEQDQEQEQLV